MIDIKLRILLDKTLLPSETRIFLIKNPGKHTVRITSMTINNVLCSGYGFRILDCRKFSLLPNQSREVKYNYTEHLNFYYLELFIVFLL